jgi:hypothetical protein
MDDDNEDELHILLHAFPLPVCVPCFLLESTVLTSNKESLTGIATRSRIDDTGEDLLYRVHLESGYSLEINVGFLEIILPDPQGHEADTQPAQALVDSQQLQRHGCYSSCKEETDDEGGENHWPTEMMHNPNFTNFIWNSHETGGCREAEESNSENERVVACESLKLHSGFTGD